MRDAIFDTKKFSWGSTSKWAGSPPSSSSPSSSMSSSGKFPHDITGHETKTLWEIYRHLLSSSRLLRGQPGKGLKRRSTKIRRVQIQKHTSNNKYTLVWCVENASSSRFKKWSETRDLKLSEQFRIAQTTTNSQYVSMLRISLQNTRAVDPSKKHAIACLIVLHDHCGEQLRERVRTICWWWRLPNQLQHQMWTKSQTGKVHLQAFWNF